MQNERNNIVAVVVTYNRKELLKRCLESIIGQKNVTCDALIIDNASTDGTEEMIQNDFQNSKVFYRNTGANLGGAGGFEYGVREAVQRGYQYIWIMDDDTIPNDDALHELMKAGDKLNGEWGFLSSVAYWTDGSICRMNIQKKNIFRHIGAKEYQTEISEIKMCSFVSLLIKASVVCKIGLPIGAYFIWTDDYEFTGRISSQYPCYMVTKSKVTHAMKTHIRVNFAQDSRDRIERYHYIYRNDVHCYRQYGIMGWLYIITKDIYTMADILLHSQGNKLWKIKTIFRGFGEGLHFQPVIAYPEAIRGGTSEE